MATPLTPEEFRKKYGYTTPAKKTIKLPESPKSSGMKSYAHDYALKKNNKGTVMKSSPEKDIAKDLGVPPAEVLKIKSNADRQREIDKSFEVARKLSLPEPKKSFADKALDTGLDVAYGLGGVSSGLTLGLTDKLMEKLGVDIPEEGRSEQAKSLHNASELAGSLVSGGKIFNAAGKIASPMISKAGQLISKLPVPAVKLGQIAGATGAVETTKGAFTPNIERGDDNVAERLGRSLRRGTGDTLGLIGSSIERPSVGLENLGFRLKDAGESVSEGFESNYTYDETGGDFNFSDITNPLWWTERFGAAIPTSAALMIPAIITRKPMVAGLEKVGLSELAASLGATGLQVPLLTIAEAGMEGGGTYEEVLTAELNKGTPEDEAKIIADQAATQVTKDNVKMLLASNAASLGIAFTPINKLKSVGKAGQMAVRGAAEVIPGSLEEGAQTAIGNRASGVDNRGIIEQIANPTPEMLESLTMGGIMESGMGIIGGTMQGNKQAAPVKATPTPEPAPKPVPEVVPEQTPAPVSTPEQQLDTETIIGNNINDNLDKEQSWSKLTSDRPLAVGVSKEEHDMIYDLINDEKPSAAPSPGGTTILTPQGESTTEVKGENVVEETPEVSVESEPIEETIQTKPESAESLVIGKGIDGKDRTVQTVLEQKYNAGKPLPKDSVMVSDQTEENNPQIAMASELAKLNGDKLLVVTPTTAETDRFNGFRNDANKVIVINDKADNPLHLVMYHEIGHAMETTTPEIFKAWKDTLDELAGDGVKNWYNDKHQKYTEKEWDSLNDDEKYNWVREFMSDSLQEVASRDNFYKRLMSRSTEAAREFLKTLRDLIKQLKGSTIAGNYKTTKYIKDMEAWETACTKAFADYMNNQHMTEEERANKANKPKAQKKNFTPPESKVTKAKEKIESKPEVKPEVDKLSNDELLQHLDKALEEKDDERAKSIATEIRKREKSTAKKTKTENKTKKNEPTKTDDKSSEKRKLAALNKKAMEESESPHAYYDSSDIADEEGQSISEQIKKGKGLLTREEEKELGRLIQNGDKKEKEWARKTLVERNLGLVKKLANKNKNRGIGLSFDDLMQEGVLGLMEAANHFDPEKPSSFATMSHSYIVGHMNRAIYKSQGVPERSVMIFNKYLELNSELQKELGRKPTLEEISEKMPHRDGKPVTVKMIENAVQSMQFTADIDMPVGESGETTFGELLSDRNTIGWNPPNRDAYEEVLIKEIDKNISNILSDELTDKQKLVIAYKLGFSGVQPKDGKELTFAEIGKLMGVSKETTRKQYEKAMNILRSNENLKQIYDEDFSRKLGLIPSVEEMFSMKYRTEGFYSRSEKAIESKKFPNVIGKPKDGKLSEAIGKALVSNGVKKEEIKWLQLEMLDMFFTKITKNELLDHIKDALVRIDIYADELFNVGKEWKRRYDGSTNSWMDILTDNDGMEFVVHELFDDENTPLDKFELKYPYGQTEVFDNVDEAMEAAELAMGGPDSPLYDTYTTFNKNYKEVVLSLSNFSTTWESNHWPKINNALLHIRLSDTEDSEGNPVLFVEEIQSDVHQEGHKNGYITDEANRRIDEVVKEMKKSKFSSTRVKRAFEEKWRGVEYQHKPLKEDEVEEFNNDINEIRNYNKLRVEYDKFFKLSPQFPYSDVKAWTLRAIKQIISVAVQGKYDKVAFINGEQSASRWDSSLLYEPEDMVVISNNPIPDNDIYSYDGDPRIYQITIISNGRPKTVPMLSLEKIASAYGQEMADIAEEVGPGKSITTTWGKVMTQTAREKGMNEYYDRIVPSVLDSYIKKWGLKSEKMLMSIYDEASDEMYLGEQTSFSLNEELIRDIIEEGQELFSTKRERTTKMGFPTTMSRSPLYSEEDARELLANMVEKGDTYTIMQLDDLVSFCKTELGKGIESAAKKFKSDDLKAGQKTALGIYISLSLSQKSVELKNKGDISGSILMSSSATDFLMDVSTHLTRAGQEVAAARLVEKFTPADVMARIKRVSNKAYDKLRPKVKKEIETSSKVIYDGMNRINANTIDDVMSGLTDVINDLKPTNENKSNKATNEIILAKLEEHFRNGVGDDDPILQFIKTIMDGYSEKFSTKDQSSDYSPLDIARRFLDGDPLVTQNWDKVRRELLLEYGEVFNSPQEFFSYYLTMPSSEAGLSRTIAKVVKMLGVTPNQLVDRNTKDRVIEQVLHLTNGKHKNMIIAKVEHLNNKYKEDAASNLAKRLIKLTAPREVEVKDENEETTVTTNEIISHIMKLAKEKLPKSIPDPKDPMDLIAQILTFRKEYQKLWMGAERDIIEKYPENKADIETLQEFFNRPIDDLFTKSQIEKLISKGLKEDGLTIRDVVKQHYTERSAIFGSLAERLITKAGLKEEDAINLSKVIESKFDEISREKKQQMLDGLFTQVKKRNRKALVDKVIEYSNMGAFSEEHYRNIICEKIGIPTISPETAILINEICDRIQTASYRSLLSNDEKYEIRWTNTYKYQLLDKEQNEIGRYNTLQEAQEHAPESEWSGYGKTVGREEKNQLISELYFMMAVQAEPSLLRKISTVQTMAMILNMVTIGKNLLGNATVWYAENAALTLAVPVDIARSKITKTERKLAFHKNINPLIGYKDFAHGFLFGADMARKGYTPRGVEGQYEVGYAPTFYGAKDYKITGSPTPANISKFIQKYVFRQAETAMRMSLLSPDQASYTRAFEGWLDMQARLLCINNGKEITPDNLGRYKEDMFDNLEEQCKEYAKVLTFQNDTEISNKMAAAKRGLNAGLEFGAGDVIIKFTKVASNLFMFGIDYSVYGFLRGLAICNGVLTKNGPNIANGELIIGRALVGTTGFCGFGLWMGMLGILTGDADDDEKVKMFEKSMGNTMYKFNFSAFKRYVMSRFDKDASKWQDGDTIYNYNWLQPMATPISMGVAISDEVKKSKSGKDVKVTNIFKAGMDSLFANSIFTGLTDLTKTQYDEEPGMGTMLYNAVDTFTSNVMASFIPATVRQNRSKTDPYLRSTYSDNSLTRAKNLLLNRLPEVSTSLPSSKSLPMQVDYLGYPIKKSPGNEESMMNNYITPWNKNNYVVGPEHKKIIFDVYQETKNPSALPSAPNRTITTDGEDTKLTTEQYNELLKIRGEYIKDKINKSNRLKDISLPSAKKVEILHDIYVKSGERAREDMRKKL